jgi:hypothetical protein
METSIRTPFTLINGSFFFDECTASRGSADTGKFTRARYVTARKQSTKCTGNPCRQQQEDAVLAQEEPHGEGVLASQLPCLKPFELFYVGRF